MVRRSRRSELAGWSTAIVIGFLARCTALDPPGQLLDLSNTTWRVEAVAGSAIEGDRFRVSFDGSMHISVLTPCQSLTGTYQVDTDGDALTVDVAPIERHPCTNAEAAGAASVLSAIEATEYWSVASDTRISLHGATTVDLARQEP